MKSIGILLAPLLLASGAAVAASDWVERIREVVPASITLTEVEETDGYVTLAGRAKSNSDIAGLMRAIEAADRGSPVLQQVKRNGETQEFVLRVKAPIQWEQ